MSTTRMPTAKPHNVHQQLQSYTPYARFDALGKK